MKRLLISLIFVGACSDTVSDPDPWKFGEDSPAAEEPATVGEEPVLDEEPPPKSDEPRPEVPRDWFAGHWLIAQPNHALYEETLYDFRLDGTLSEVASFSYGHPIPTGRVARCETFETHTWEECDASNSSECVTHEVTTCTAWGVECLFGDTWTALDEQTISIAGDCADARSRDIVLSFAEAPASDPTVVSVGGEPDWLHNSFDWAWIRCDEANPRDCMLGP